MGKSPKTKSLKQAEGQDIIFGLQNTVLHWEKRDAQDSIVFP